MSPRAGAATMLSTRGAFTLFRAADGSVPIGTVCRASGSHTPSVRAVSQRLADASHVIVFLPIRDVALLQTCQDVDDITVQFSRYAPSRASVQNAVAALSAVGCDLVYVSSDAMTYGFRGTPSVFANLCCRSIHIQPSTFAANVQGAQQVAQGGFVLGGMAAGAGWVIGCAPLSVAGLGAMGGFGLYLAGLAISQAVNGSAGVAVSPDTDTVLVGVDPTADGDGPAPDGGLPVMSSIDGSGTDGLGSNPPIGDGGASLPGGTGDTGSGTGSGDAGASGGDDPGDGDDPGGDNGGDDPGSSGAEGGDGGGAPGGESTNQSWTGPKPH